MEQLGSIKIFSVFTLDPYFNEFHPRQISKGHWYVNQNFDKSFVFKNSLVHQNTGALILKQAMLCSHEYVKLVSPFSLNM